MSGFLLNPYALGVAELFSFTTTTFGTPISGGGYSTGTSGPTMFGPTESQLSSYYTSRTYNAAGATLSTLLSANLYFKVPIQGYQWFMVPATGNYTILANGGRGGSAGATGRSGCQLQATFALNAGDILWITVGHNGSTGNSSTTTDLCSAGGGGATFVGYAPAGSGTTLGNITKCLICAAGGRGSPEGRFSPSTPAASSSQDGTTSAGFDNFKAGNISGGYGGYGGYYGYGGFGGGSASDDNVGPSGGYDALRNFGTSYSFVDPTGSSVTRTDVGSSAGFVTLTKV